MLPVSHFSLQKQFKAQKKKKIATGSLKSLRTKMECILYEVQHININAYGGTCKIKLYFIITYT